MPILVTSYVGVGIERLFQYHFAVGYAQTLVQILRVRPSCYRPAPVSGPQIHDTHLQGHAGLGTSYLDGTAQRVAFAAPRGAEVLETPALSRFLGRLQPLSRLNRTENDHVPGIYGQSWAQPARKDAA